LTFCEENLRNRKRGQRTSCKKIPKHYPERPDDHSEYSPKPRSVMTFWDLLASSGFSALAGVIVAAGLTFVFTEVRERRAFRRSLSKLAIEAALDNWRAEVSRRHEDTKGDDVQWTEKPDRYLAEMFELMDVASDPTKSLKETATLLSKRRKP
jgi:hypothetical protein